MSNNPIQFFEKSIRMREESPDDLVPDLKIDELLGFCKDETDRLVDALMKNYPVGHWAIDGSNFRHTIEMAMQLLSAGLCKLGSSVLEGNHPLDCCIRIVNAPTITPYALKSKYNYVIVSTGFISALEKFISSTYAMATVAAFQRDPDKQTFLWDEDMFLGSIISLADSDIFTFSRGIMEASLETSLQQVLDKMPYFLGFLAFDRKMNAKMLKMMPFASSWQKLGYTHLSEALERHQEVKSYAQKIARLSVCFTICHEFGHVFIRAVDHRDAEELAHNETLADMIGSQIMHRLVDAKVIQIIVGSGVTHRDLGNALVGFHSWNLSKVLSTLLREPETIKTEDALTNIHNVAVRWQQAMISVQKVWNDHISNPIFADIDEKVTVGTMIVNCWAVITAGMLRVVLLKKGQKVDIATAGKILTLLADRNSVVYDYLNEDNKD